MNPRTTEIEVRAVPEPAWTSTWHPVGHARLIDTMNLVADKEGLNVVDKHYSLSATGDKMFGEWVLEGDSKIRQMIGFRNSINKAFAVGLAAGLWVMVCSNMIMRGDFIEFHKHTSGLDDLELLDLCKRGVGRVTERFAQLEAWHTSLQNIPLGVHSNYLTIEAMRRGALPPSKFTEFDRLFFQEEGRYFAPEPTLANFHGAIAEVMHKDSLFSISRKNKSLSELVDDFKILLLNNRLYPGS